MEKQTIFFSTSLDFPSVLRLARTAAPNRELNRAFRLTFVLGSGRARMGFGPCFDKIFAYFRPDTTIVNKLSWSIFFLLVIHSVYTLQLSRMQVISQLSYALTNELRRRNN